MDDLVIRVKPPGGSWETLGAGVFRRAKPENVVLTANEWGSDTATFEMKRFAGVPYLDLQPFTEVDVEVGGLLVWAGRVKETPTTDADEDVIHVQAEGWQYHLDDASYSKLFVHTRLSDWRDARTFDVDIGNEWVAALNVSQEAGHISLGAPKGTEWLTTRAAGVVLDVGALAVGVKNIVVKAQRSNGSPGSVGVRLYARASTALGYTGYGGGGSGVDLISAYNVDSFSQAQGGSYTAGSATGSSTLRFVTLFLYNSGATYTAGGEDIIKLLEVKVFGDDAYRSGNDSVLKASQVVAHALTKAPLLDQNAGLIETTSFSIPELFFFNPVTAREAVTAVNAFHNYVAKVTPERLFIFKARPSAPAYEVGSWSGGVFEDASAGSGQEIYNKVIVQGTDAAGQTILVERTASVDLLTAAGLTRTKILLVEAALTTATANQIGDTFLAAHSSTPFKGSLTIKGPRAIRQADGGVTHPAVLLRGTGEVLRLTHVIDPTTGNVGRDGIIATVTYTHDQREAKVELDNSRRNFEAFLARLGVVTASGAQ
jgi:hypothetical protein